MASTIRAFSRTLNESLWSASSGGNSFGTHLAPDRVREDPVSFSPGALSLMFLHEAIPDTAPAVPTAAVTNIGMDRQWTLHAEFATSQLGDSEFNHVMSVRSMRIPYGGDITDATVRIVFHPENPVSVWGCLLWQIASYPTGDPEDPPSPVPPRITRLEVMPPSGGGAGSVSSHGPSDGFAWAQYAIDEHQDFTGVVDFNDSNGRWEYRRGRGSLESFGLGSAARFLPNGDPVTTISSGGVAVEAFVWVAIGQDVPWLRQKQRNDAAPRAANRNGPTSVQAGTRASNRNRYV